MKVRIICGSYGYRTKYGVKPVMLGETCEVDGMEAGRLVGLGIAEIVDAPAAPSATAPAPSAFPQPTRPGSKGPGGTDVGSSARRGSAPTQTAISFDWIRLTPAASMSFQAAASEPFRSMARVASSTT